jgi:hypothetical protein
LFDFTRLDWVIIAIFVAGVTIAGAAVLLS